MMAEIDEIQVLEGDLYEFLPTMNDVELQTIFEKIQVVLPEAAKGKKNVLLRLLNKQIAVFVADDVGGLAQIKVIHDFITSIRPVKTEDVSVVDEEAELSKFEAMLDKKLEKLKVSSVNASTTKLTSKLEVSKFQTLKINGTIGTKTGCMSFTDLNFQIKNAQDQGYSDEQVCGAVIKAMSTNNNLRTYFESLPECKLDEMLEILRPYFEQKNSASLFADLCNAAQASEQNCMDFVVGLLGLKLRIADLSSEEGAPMDNKILVGQFQKSLFTGIRNSNVRTDVREFCRGNPTASDQQLIKIVADAMAIERDRAKKMAGGADVCYLGVDHGDGNVQNGPKTAQVTQISKKKENLLPAQVQELKISQEKLVASVSELQTAMATTNNLLVAHLSTNTTPVTNTQNTQGGPPQGPPQAQGPQGQGFSASAQPFGFGANNNFSYQSPFTNVGPAGMRGGQGSGNNSGGARNRGGRRGKGVFKCGSCLMSNLPRCDHCFRCGKTDHKFENCPEQSENRNNGGGMHQGHIPGNQ